MPSKPYKSTTEDSQNLRSLTCSQVSPSSLIAFSHASLVWSSETPRIVKFLSLNLLYAATRWGFSIRQGRHQLAQKSTSTYFPFKELSAKGLPLISGNTKSGACFPTQLLFFKRSISACILLCRLANPL